MVVIIKLRLGHLRNAEHFQFQCEMRNIVTKADPTTLKIAKLFTPYMAALQKEDERLMLLRKSNFTEPLAEAESDRDLTWKGFSYIIKGNSLHHNAEIKEAGKRLLNVFKAYGNLANKPVDEETAGIYNLVVDLETKYSVDVDTIDAKSWLVELKNRNLAYDQLVKSRYAEKAEIPDADLKEVRTEVDALFRKICASIEALYELSANATEEKLYKNLISQLNVVVERYKHRLARRYGVYISQKQKESEEEEVQVDDDYLIEDEEDAVANDE